MFENERVCSTCDFWQRDGADGICRKSNPKPVISEAGKLYTAIWPRTNALEWCGGHKKIPEIVN